MRKPHTQPAYDGDLARLHGLVEQMASRAREMLLGSRQALETLDAEAAKRIIASDGEVNRLEVEIDELCLELLVRWQPVASDLRFIAAAFKVVTDLERIGDHCVNISRSVLELRHEVPFQPPVDLSSLGAAVDTLLGDALTALRTEDVQLAAQVLERDQRVEALVGEVLRACLEALRQSAHGMPLATRLHGIAGYLQRIAAHATNIAEMVVFLVRGEDVRHVRDRRSPPAAASTAPAGAPTAPARLLLETPACEPTSRRPSERT
jgi:phosphate transport system protein